MKFTLFAYVLVVAISVFKFNLTFGFRLKINEFDKNDDIEGVNNSAGDSNNTNNNVIKVENNQGSEEIEKISQVDDRQDVNFKSDQVPRLLRTPLHQQTVSDQFYENTGSLGGIQGEKIATYDKKLENISELKSLEAIIDFKNKLGEKTWRLVSKMINNPYDVSKVSIHLNKKHKEPPEILKAPYQSPRSKRQNQGDFELNEDDLFSSEFATIPKGNEQNHISNIKQEISKLQSLVQILKDQQSILNLLEEVSNDTMDVNTFKNAANLNNSNSTNWIESGIDDMDQIGNKRNGNDKFKLPSISSSNLTEDVNAIKIKLNELKYLFIQEVLPKLNDQSSDRKKMKLYIDRELAKQKDDLFKMKRLILNIFKKLFGDNKINPIHNNPTDNVNDEDEFKRILKELQILEKNMSKMLSQRSLLKNEIVEMNIDKVDGGGTETSVEDPFLDKTQMTSKEKDDDIESNLNDLLEALEIKETSTEKIENKKLNDLLKELDQSENGDSLEMVSKEHGSKLSDTEEIEVTEALTGLVKLLDENFNSETKANRILNRFRKILSTQTKNKKSDDRLMAEVLRRLLNKSQSKNFDQNIGDDKDMMTRLKELSRQIDKLQQKDEDVDKENNNFQTLLQELINKEQKKIEKKPARPKLKLTKSEMAKLLKKLTDFPMETTKNLPVAGRYKCEILPDYNDKLENYQNFAMHHVPLNYINNNLQNWPKFNSYHSPNYPQIPTAKYDIIPVPSDKIFDQNYLRPNPVQYLFRGTPTSSLQFKNPPYFEEVNQDFNTPHTGQYPIDAPEDSSSDVEEKTDELKRQLNSLGMVISSLGQPEYSRRKDDMKIVDDLNNQVNHLKYVIDGLSYDPNLKHYGNFETMVKGESYHDGQNNNDASYRQIEKDQSNQLNYVEENRNLITNRTFTNNPIQLQIRDGNIQPSHTYSDLNLKLTPNSAISEAEIESNNPNGADKLQSNTGVQKIRRDTQQIDSEKLRSLLLRLLEDGIEDDETSRDNNIEDFDQQNDLESDDEADSVPESARSSVFKINRRHNSKKRLRKLNIFDKIFTKILDKIIDKLQIAIPRIIERLFGLNQFYGNTYQNYGYGGNVIQTFRNFGITGYFPLIILKGVYSLSFLISELQKIPFIRNFLVPFGIVGLVAASTVFLIYWLQPNLYQSGLDSAYQYVQPYNTYNPYKYSHYSIPYPVRTYNDYTNNMLYPLPRKPTVNPSNNYYKSNPYNNYYNRGNMYRNVYPSGYS